MEAATTVGVVGLIERQVRFAKLANRKAAIEAELAEITAEMSQLENPILDGMATIGQPRTNIEGRTLYVHRQLWASASVDKETAAKALAAEGMGDLVSPTFNTNTISAIFREWDKQEDDGVLSADDAAKRDRLLGSFKVAEKFSLRATK
jgi:hypothetical protein